MDIHDPLYQIYKDALAGNTISADAIFGSSTTYDLVTLSPWNDVRSADDADYVATTIIDRLTKPDEQGKVVLEAGSSEKKPIISKPDLIATF